MILSHTALANILQSYRSIRVRQDSFYAFNAVKTGSLSTCANICTEAIKRGKRVQGFVYREQERSCEPAEFAPFEIDESGTREGNWTEAFLSTEKAAVGENYGKLGSLQIEKSLSCRHLIIPKFSLLCFISLSSVAQEYYLIPGHCSMSILLLYTPGGICSGPPLDPTLPPLPSYVKSTHFSVSSYQNGVILTCGFFNYNPCTPDPSTYPVR